MKNYISYDELTKSTSEMLADNLKGAQKHPRLAHQLYSEANALRMLWIKAVYLVATGQQFKTDYDRMGAVINQICEIDDRQNLVCEVA